MSKPTGPLVGKRIIDLTQVISGPMSTMLLADQGADVIKVESPSGDSLRLMGPKHNGLTAVFFSCNRNKRSIVLDLASDEGKETLRDLIATADVLVQNFRPGAIDRMGFSERAVREIKPDIVYVSVSGFGKTGPYSSQRVYDPVIQALSGLTDIQYDRETGDPRMINFVIADKITALMTAQAVTAALVARAETGEGQAVDLSMLDSVVSTIWPHGMIGLTYEEQEFDIRAAQNPMDSIFPTKDGRHVTASCVTDSEWEGICKSLDRPDWIEDERFNNAFNRTVNGEERKKLMAEEIARFNSEDILDRFEQYQAPAAPLVNRMELMKNAQVQASETITTDYYEGFGNVRQPRPAAKFSVTPSEIRSAAPQFGEHSASILKDLGYSDQRIAELVNSGALICADTSGS